VCSALIWTQGYYLAPLFLVRDVYLDEVSHNCVLCLQAFAGTVTTSSRHGVVVSVLATGPKG
jgi:hypothetical protein